MNESADFLSLLRSAGFTIRADSERLYVEPRGNLTAADCDTIRRLKPGLLALVNHTGELERCSGPCGCSVQPAAREDIRRLCIEVHGPFKPSVRTGTYTPRKRFG